MGENFRVVSGGSSPCTGGNYSGRYLYELEGRPRKLSKNTLARQYMRLENFYKSAQLVVNRVSSDEKGRSSDTESAFVEALRKVVGHHACGLLQVKQS